ncbi:MAG: hypothetical protein ABIP93_20420 [Gemmatimonadaceae bacterium]
MPRRYGESEKEYATQNEAPSIVLRAGEGGVLRAMLAFVERTKAVWQGEGFALALESLSASGAIGVGWPMRLVLLVGACEALLLPDRRSGLQHAFVNRLACMIARDHAQVEEWAAWLRPAYDLRSDVVHGRPLDSIDDLTVLPEQYARDVGRVVIHALCRLVSHRMEHPAADSNADPLWRLLDRAPATASAFDELQTRLRSEHDVPAHQFTLVPRC